MSSKKSTTEPPQTLRRANDAAGSGSIEPPAALFEEFWREGELALLFGEAGVGKSLLAVEIAEALARGRAAAGLGEGGKRRNVLYVDLVLSDVQFRTRYSRSVRGKGRRMYGFSQSFFRDCPREGDDLAKWLRRWIKMQKIDVVVIDDLSVVTRTVDGTRQTLDLVRELRRITREMGVSVLVLADSHPTVAGRPVAERDLRRQRVLCAYADSVFAMEFNGRAGMRHIVQTRTQSAAFVWTHRSPARFQLTPRADEGFPGFEFYDLELPPDQRDLVVKIKSMADKGMTIRAIARDLKMTKSKVDRMLSKWRPEFESVKEPEPEVSDWKPIPERYRGEHTDNYLESIGIRRVWWEKLQKEQEQVQWQAQGQPDLSEPPASAGGQDDQSEPPLVALPLDVRKSSAFPLVANKSSAATPPAEAEPPESVEASAGKAELFRTSSGVAAGNLRRALDGYGHEILIAEECPTTLKPLHWFKTDRHGRQNEYRRTPLGIMINSG